MERELNFYNDGKQHYQSFESTLELSDIDANSNLSAKIEAFGEDEKESSENMLLKINELIYELEQTKTELSKHTK